ncbi:MAG: type IVB secretion system protein IcmJDotN [Bdellovibrionales bacterium]
MKTGELSLGIFRPPTKSKGAGKLPNDLKQKIIERDNYTCNYCGFKAKKYQEIFFLNQDDGDHREKNMVTTCIFCHQCFQLEKVSEMKSGVLIWLPEIQQKELHHIARSIYVARISQGPVAEAARKNLDIIMSRREEAKKRISTDDPYILSTVLRDYLGPKSYKERMTKLEGIRLFPLDRRIIKEAELEFNQFPQILAYWRSKDGPFGGKAPPTWVAKYQELLAKTA